jgi:hypothetical protein
MSEILKTDSQVPPLTQASAEDVQSVQKSQEAAKTAGIDPLAEQDKQEAADLLASFDAPVSTPAPSPSVTQEAIPPDEAMSQDFQKQFTAIAEEMNSPEFQKQMSDWASSLEDPETAKRFSELLRSGTNNPQESLDKALQDPLITSRIVELLKLGTTPVLRAVEKGKIDPKTGEAARDMIQSVETYLASQKPKNFDSSADTRLSSNGTTPGSNARNEGTPPTMMPSAPEVRL